MCLLVVINDGFCQICDNDNDATITNHPVIISDKAHHFRKHDEYISRKFSIEEHYQ